jgi:hypothetical protein
MRLPYRRHLLWLVALGASEEEVAAYYRNNSFPFPEELEFEKLRLDVDQSMLLPNGGRRRVERKRYAESDHELLSKMGFGELYVQSIATDRLDGDRIKAWEEIGELIANPVMRVALECAIIAKAPPGDLPDLMQLGFRQTFGGQAYELYKEVFFDIKGWGKEDWKKLLELVSDDPFTYTRYFAALTKPRDEVFFLLGLPTEKQYSDFLKNVLLTADHKFRYWARLNDAGADDEAREWARIGIEAGEKHAKHAKKDIKNFADEVQTSFEYVTDEIPMATAEMLADARPVEDAKSKTDAVDKIAPGGKFQDNENF